MSHKANYDRIQMELAKQAKARRLAREAGNTWKIGHPQETRYWSLKSQLELMECR